MDDVQSSAPIASDPPQHRNETDDAEAAVHQDVTAQRDIGGGNATPPLQRSRATLSNAEIYWRDKQQWLQATGYMLRPRYRPGWKPSWEGTKKFALMCEDGRSMGRASVLDATRTSDNELVMLKKISKTENPGEVDIARYFSSEPVASDPRNHCVPVYEVLHDPDNEDISILVMPFLRLSNDPRFQTVGEIVAFFSQIFEGLLFMHEHRVAHRDCMSLNIMMDPRPMFPDLYHPIFNERTRDFRGKAKYFSRTERPTKYYLIDFGLSRKYSANNLSPREPPVLGGDKTVPEFQGVKLLQDSDPFPVDVYYLGNVIGENLQEYCGIDFMGQLMEDMTHSDPDKRPVMSEVVERFHAIRGGLKTINLRRRLVRRKEGKVLRLLYDGWHTVVSASYILRRLPPIPDASSATSPSSRMN